MRRSVRRDMIRLFCGLAGAAVVAAPAAAQEGDHPNLNGIWQAVNTAYWNLEGHGASGIKGFMHDMGAFASIPPGQSVVVGGEIPYLPEALKKRDENRAQWPQADPAASCYMPGIPRANYMPYPFQIVQGEDEIMFIYSFAKANRVVHMTDHTQAPIDYWMGWSNGHWEGDTLVVEVTANDDRTWLDRSGNFHSYAMKVTERFTPVDDTHIDYEATIEDPETFSRPWTIKMPLYKRTEPNAELLEYNCVPFSEPLLYGDLERKTPRDAPEGAK